MTRKQLLSLATVAACVLCLSATAPAYMWEQTPDLSTSGMDVNCMHVPWVAPVTILYDDFVITETTTVETIVMWGSMRLDVGSASDFSISISDDNSGLPGTGLSSSAVSVTETVHASELAEGWYNPHPDNTEYIPSSTPGDTICYQWELTLSDPVSLDPGRYWFGITIRSLNDTGNAGWKTTANPDSGSHDAVFKVLDSTGWSGFQSLAYPTDHPDEGDPINFAFAIVPEPATFALLVGGGVLGLLRRRDR